MKKTKKIICTIFSFAIMLGLISTVVTPTVLAAEVKYVVKPQFDAVCEFSEGLAAVNVGCDRTDMGGKWGFIDKTGKIVIKLQYDNVEPFVEGVAMVEVGGKCGLIDKTGKMIINPQFKHELSFNEGLAMVEVGGKWGFINKTGKMIINPQFEHVGSFSEGLASVYVGEKWGFIDKTGEMVIKPQFNHIIPSSEGLRGISLGNSKDGQGDKWGFIANPLAKTPTPKISIVSLDHVPFVEGDNNEFYISAKDYTGQVQYQLFYIQESVMKDWKLINNVDMTNGWTNPIDAQTPIIVDVSTLKLKADKYRFAIRVRRVGVIGLNQNSYGDYDDAYPFNVDVVKNANIKLNDNINIEKTSFTKSENLVINGVGNSQKDMQYKLHLFDVKNSKWLTDLTEYNTNVNYSLKNIPEGTYIIDLWAKNNGSKNKYDGWKLKVINIQKQKDAEKEEPELLTVDQAMNILKTRKSTDERFNYEKKYYYTPDHNYVNPTTYSNYAEIKNNYYIFSYSDLDGGEADSNLCVNKKTGEIYVADPSGKFITLNERENLIINNH